MERRGTRRFKVDNRCWFDSSAVLRFVSLKDLSLAGAQVQTLSPLEPGAPVRLRWAAEDAEISIDAKVVWIKPGDEGGSLVGVVFEHVHTPEPLTRFIRQREIDPTCVSEFSQTSTPTSKP